MLVVDFQNKIGVLLELLIILMKKILLIIQSVFFENFSKSCESTEVTLQKPECLLKLYPYTVKKCLYVYIYVCEYAITKKLPFYIN